MVRSKRFDSVLITGANGFIGKALCKRMLAENWRVRGAIRSTHSKIVLPRGVEIFQIKSLGPYTDWSETLVDIDCVIHLAARVHVINDTATDSLSAFRWLNVKGTERLARMAARSGCRRFFFMSTVKVNGEERPQAYTERDMPKPLGPYGISKWEAEQVLHEIAKATGLEVTILRPSMVYGPGVKANFLRLVRSVARGVPLPLASVNNRRSLIYLENLVDAIITCIKHPRAAGQTYCVSDGEDVSTPELIRRISSALARPVRLFPFPPILLKISGIITGKSVVIDRLLRSLTIDCSKIRRELDWQAPFSMEQGLRETAKWYQKKED